MLFNSFSLTCLFLTNFLIQPTTCALPTNLQNLQLDDITSIWDKFPSIIDKIKEAVSRFRCPKGWKRLGGSCYYLSNLTSTSIDANDTCNLLHSNLSNLIQIRNTVELFYAAHVLSRNKLSSLMIDIDPNLLKGGKISEILMNDQGRWERMKGKFHEVRVKYQKLKEKIVDKLSSTGIRILRRTKKVKQIPRKQQVIHDEIDLNQYDEYDFDDRESNITSHIFQNNTTINSSSVIDNDEYEYDDLDSPDETDEFEQIEDIHGICDRIDWNVDNNNSTVYILTTYIVSDKTVCSFSDVELGTEYHHICEYVLDFCFANIICGKHGQCENTLAGFKCSCTFLYGGLLCEKLSEHGRQIIISIIIIIILAALSVKPIRWLLWMIMKSLIHCCKKCCNARKKNEESLNNDRQQLVETDKLDNNGRIILSAQLQQRRPTFAQEFIEFLVPKTSNSLLTPIKRNLARTIWVAMLNLFFLSLLYVSTSLIYLVSFGYFISDESEEEFSINDTIRLVTQCERISDYRRGNIIFAPFALVLILIFCWSVKREKQCLDMCDGRPALIPPIEPFRTGNRFTTATVFGILAFEVLKIFEELLFSTGQPLHQGVLIELLERIALVILVGLRYYPVLASLQLRNIVARFFTCLYIICDMIYTIVREGSCMGFLPLSGHYTALEEAKLRKELGTWFIVYGLIKNIPHFFLLSYISAELCVRFIYDSIYVPLRKNKSIWSSPIVQLDESAFAKFYVTKLFRRNYRSIQTPIPQNTKINLDSLIDHEHEAELQNRVNQSRVKKIFDSIYHSDDDFRFTTIATCTYTVAVVFLYYLACTFVFLYLSRTTGHISFIKFYIESTFNVELGAFSLKLEVIFSAIFTVIIYGFQLFVGMQNYKKHKLQLFRGIYDFPSADNFKPSSLASNSVNYSGFLVGYMAWGFVICFHLILVIMIILRILSLQIRHVELILAIVVPVLVIYFLKMLSMRSAGKFLFIQQLDDKLNLKSRKTYAIFLYFSFFADCFLGIASCIIRLIKATFLNVVFMARLDWSSLGRPLERFDRGFAAYYSYLHMEATYTNPVMLAFCYTLFDDIVQRRPKHCYDDECCIAPGELDDEDEIETSRQNQIQQNRKNLTQNVPSVRYRRRNNDNVLITDSNNLNPDEPILKETKQDLSTIEITSETESPKLCTISTKKRQKHTGRKMKRQQSIIVGEEEHSNTLTIPRFIPQQQPSFDFAPAVPPRADLPLEQDESDYDGGLHPKSFSTISKIIPEERPRLTAVSQSSKINIDDQEDGGVSKQKISAAEKKKKKKIPQKTTENHDDDVSKRQVSNKKKPKKEDEARERIVKTDNTVKMIIPSKQPVLYTEVAKEEPSSDNTDDGSKRASKHQKSTTSTSYDTVGRIVPKISDPSRIIKPKKTTDNYRYDTIPTKEERKARAKTSYCPPSYSMTTNPTDSYRETHENTLPPIPHRPNISSKLPGDKNIHDDDSSHYSEITDDTIRSAVSNRSYSEIGFIQVSSHHSTKPQLLEDQKQNEDTNAETEEEDKQEEVQLLKPRETSRSHKSSAMSPSDNTSIELEKEKEIQRIKQRKRLRFRWHFLYTILRNYHLFDLRKDVQGRLTRLHLQRSNLIDEQQLSPTITMTQPEHVKFATESITIPPEGLFTPEIPTTIEQRPPSIHRLISVPVSVSHEYPASPAERYIAIRAQMLYDAIAQQPNTPYSPITSQTPTIATSFNQQVRPPIISTFSDQSLGFRMSPDIIVQPPSVSSVKSRHIPSTTYSTPRVFQQGNITPVLFQPATTSNLSTVDYPLTASSIVNSSTLRTQMSHDQHMQLWRQDQMEKIQRKQRHGYTYGPQPPLVDRVSSAAILTPQILSTITKQQQVPPTPNDGKTERGPTVSPFQFPLTQSQVRSVPSSTISDIQSETNNQKLDTKRRQQRTPIPPPRMDRLDEDTQEISNTNKSSKITSVLIHKEDSDNDTSDVTEA